MLKGLRQGLGSLLRGRRRVAPDASVAEARVDALVRTADGARDGGRSAEAAALYAEALAAAPERVDLRVQMANMLKDSGRLLEAEEAYGEALRVRPKEADIHLQLGHVHKTLGRRERALESYRMALRLDPGSDAARHELLELGRAELQGDRLEAGAVDRALERIAALTHRMELLSREVEEVRRALPNLWMAAAFPVSLYGAYRERFDVPPAPATAGGVALGVIVEASDADPRALYAFLESLRSQTLTEWTCVVVCNGAGVREIAERAAASDGRVQWMEAGTGDRPPLPEVLREAGIVLTLGQGLALHRRALEWFGYAGAATPGRAFICDEERRAGPDGPLVGAELRQCPDLEMLLQADVAGHAVAFRSGELEGARLPLAELRVRRLLQLAEDEAVGHLPLPLVQSFEPAAPSPDASRYATCVAEYLRDRHGNGPSAPRLTGHEPGPPAILWPAPSSPSAICVVVPTRDNAADAASFLSTLSRSAEEPERVEALVIDNGTSEEASLVELDRLRERPGVRVERFDEPFNWSRLNNRAARLTQAPILVFANDDMTMLSRGWDVILDRLLHREDVGAVGPKLFYPDATIQHAGVIFGWRGGNIHDGLHAPGDDPGPMMRWNLQRRVVAVDGAFLATRRQVFLEQGGFDEEELPVSSSDVDYCLRLRSSGLSILYAPAIRLVHHESKSRGSDHADPARGARYLHEHSVLQRRWGRFASWDPTVNPIWYDGGRPFQMIRPSSEEALLDYVARSGSGGAWRVEPSAAAS
ncbi:tetratricopeptide repeat protein [Lutibaculum baratangense]|nr:glycosyltransferase [Lutibaculum baratangense]